MLEWTADDPRLETVRDNLVLLLEADAKEWSERDQELLQTLDEEMSDELAALLDSVFLSSVPIAPRLLELLEERGWRGWTKFERIEPRPRRTGPPQNS
jgi:hypothetical protein